MGRAETAPGRLRTLLGQGATLVVRGPAGIGKSTLVHRVLRGRPYVVGQSLEPLRDLPHHPLAHALGRVFDGSSADVASDVAGELVGRTLVIEDAHWGDDPTLEVLALLAGRISLVVTTRSTISLESRPRVEVVDVPPLEPRAAHAVAQRLHPGLDAVARQRLLDLAGGNPLLLAQLVAGDVVSATLIDAVQSRVASLPAVDVEQLAVLALNVRPLPVDALDAAGAADVVRAGGLVEEHDGCVAVAHSLLADAVVRLVDDDTRRRIHERLAAISDGADAARHLLAAGEPLAAAERAERVATDASPAQRAQLLALAVDARGANAGARLRLDAAAALIVANQPAAAERMVSPLVELDAVTCAEAGLYRSQAAWLAGDEALADRRCNDALALVDATGTAIETKLRVELVTQRVRTRLGDSSVIDDAHRAWAAASRAGVDRAKARNLVGLALGHNGRPGWDDHYLAAAQLAREDDDVEQELMAMYWLISAYGFFGPIQEAIDRGPALIAATEQRGLRRLSHHVLGAHAVHRFGTGTATDELVPRVQQLLADDPLFRNRAQVDLALAIGLLDRDDRDGARDVLSTGRRFVRNDEDRSLLCVGEAEMAWAGADRDALFMALDELASCSRGFFGMNAFAESAAIHTMLDAAETTDIPSFAVSLMPVVDVVGVERAAFEAWRRGEPSAAIEGFDRAARTWNERGFIRFAARDHLAAGRVARRAGAGGEATRRFCDAAALAARWRLAPIADAARRALGDLDRDRNRARLSRREVEVLELVATGLTTSEIATRLAVGGSTVTTYVNSARGKLGAQTRMQAASMVAGGES